MAKKKVSRIDYTITKVANMMRWLVTSGVITYALIQLNDYIVGLQLSPEVGAMILMMINIALFGIRSYVDGEDK